MFERHISTQFGINTYVFSAYSRELEITWLWEKKLQTKIVYLLLEWLSKFSSQPVIFFLFQSNEKLFTCQRKPNMTMFFHVMLEWLGQNRFFFCSFNPVSFNVQFSKDIELERILMQYLQFHLKAQRNLQICKMAQVCPASQKL